MIPTAHGAWILSELRPLPSIVLDAGLRWSTARGGMAEAETFSPRSRTWCEGVGSVLTSMKLVYCGAPMSVLTSMKLVYCGAPMSVLTSMKLAVYCGAHMTWLRRRRAGFCGAACAAADLVHGLLRVERRPVHAGPRAARRGTGSCVRFQFSSSLDRISLGGKCSSSLDRSKVSLGGKCSLKRRAGLLRVG